MSQEIVIENVTKLWGSYSAVGGVSLMGYIQLSMSIFHVSIILH